MMFFSQDIPSLPGYYWAIKSGGSPQPVELQDDNYVDFLGVGTMFTADEMQTKGMLWGDMIRVPGNFNAAAEEASPYHDHNQPA